MNLLAAIGARIGTVSGTVSGAVIRTVSGALDLKLRAGLILGGAD